MSRHGRAPHPHPVRPEPGQWLDKAVHWIDQSEREKPKDGVARLRWDQRMELQILRREAEGMIRDKPGAKIKSGSP